MCICYSEDTGSIPRLKLEAAVLRTSLVAVVIKEHDYIIDSTYYWTDSSTVFQWIRGVSKRHLAFIANRIGEIVKGTEPTHWNHYPGQLNPAHEQQGTSSKLYNICESLGKWPSFLHLPEEKWPTQNLKFSSRPLMTQRPKKYPLSGLVW